MANEKFLWLHVEQLVPSKTNPRKTFDKESDAELAESIKAKKILEPLLVRPILSSFGAIVVGEPVPKFEVVNGERRYRAAKEVSLPMLPCVVRDLTDEEVVETQLISFLQHVDLNPLDEAEAYEQLRKKKFDIGQISGKVGKDRSYVAKRLQLLSLIESAKQALRKGAVSLAYALEIARLQPEAQKEALKECTDQYRPMNLMQLRKFIGANFLLNLDSAPFKKDDGVLLPKAGPCTTCPKRTGNNPDLFGDIKEGNICTDESCFQAKMEVFIGTKTLDMEAEGKELLQISDSWSSPKGSKTLGENGYEIAPRSAATRSGIFVDGDRMGQIVPIRLRGETDNQGKTSKAMPGKKLSKEELQKRYKRRLEIFENRIEQEARLRTFKLVLLRLKWPIERNDFDIILLQLIQREGYDVERLAQAVGLKDLPDVGYSDEPDIKALKKLTDQQVAQVALGIPLDQELIRDPLMHVPWGARFAALCSQHGIDLKRIHEEVAKEMAGKKPKPPKAQKAPIKKSRTSKRFETGAPAKKRTKKSKKVKK